MAEENPPEFKFNADDQDPEAFYREEIKDLRVEKLSHRITLLAILLPCLIAVAIFFAYRDLTGRVDYSEDTGSLEVQSLSRKLEDISKKFNDKLITFSTTLSTQDKNFDTTISGKLAAININLDALNKNLKSLNANLNQTRSTVKKLAASKADKKSQDAAFAKVHAALKPLKKELQSLAALRQELKTVSAGIKSLESKLNQKLAEVATAVEQSRDEKRKADKDYAQLQTSITRLSDDKIDKDTFGLEAFKLKKNLQNLLSHEITAINQKLDSIQKKIDDIQTMSKSSKRSMKSLSKKTSSATDKATAPSKSGSIDEQDLPD